METAIIAVGVWLVAAVLILLLVKGTTKADYETRIMCLQEKNDRMLEELRCKQDDIFDLNDIIAKQAEERNCMCDKCKSQTIAERFKVRA